MVRRSLAALVVVGLAGCSRDHSLLAPDPAGAGGGGGAATSAAGLVVSSAGSGGAGDGGATTGATSGATGGSTPLEPDGEPRLVLVNGLLDRERVAVCLASPRGDGVDRAPSPAAGLSFAAAVDVPAAAVPTGDGDVTVVAIAGDAVALGEVTCADVLARPGDHPDVEAVPIGALPRAAIEARRVLALIVAGCLGGQDEENELGEAACGAGFAPDAPTASLVAAPLSRITTPARVGLQAASGALAAAPFDVAVRVGSDGVQLVVARGVSVGAALPIPPNMERDAIGLSAGGDLQALALLPGDGTELAILDLEASMARSGIDAVEDGRSYAIVLVGPTPTLGGGPFWPPFDAAVIAVTP